MSKSYNPPDYAEYRFSLKQGMLACAEGTAVVAMIGYFFYRSWIACAFLIPLFGFWMREKKREAAKKRRQYLEIGVSTHMENLPIYNSNFFDSQFCYCADRRGDIGGTGSGQTGFKPVFVCACGHDPELRFLRGPHPALLGRRVKCRRADGGAFVGIGRWFFGFIKSKR